MCCRRAWWCRTRSLPSSPLNRRAVRGTGCTGVCRSIPLPFGGWLVWVWCVSEIIYHHFHAVPEHQRGCRCEGRCTWPRCGAVPLFCDLTGYINTFTFLVFFAFHLLTLPPVPYTLTTSPRDKNSLWCQRGAERSRAALPALCSRSYGTNPGAAPVDVQSQRRSAA